MEVITIGEAMVRLTAGDFQRIEQARSFHVNVAGSELNTAVGLSRLGACAAWISRLPDSPLGRLIENCARAHGVDTSSISWCSEGRVGLLFLEQGASPRPSRILYDRKDSTINRLEYGHVDWEKVFLSARFLHLSGITLALSTPLRQTLFRVAERAKGMGLKLSFDINYRKNLWTASKAKRHISSFLKFVDVLFSTSDDIESVFGIGGEAEEVAKEVQHRFGIGVVALTIREAPTVLRGAWSSVVVTPSGARRGRRVELELVDRVGSGDAFNAGFLYGLLEGDLEKAQDWGDALSALKHSIPGDFAIVTREEVETFLAGIETKIRR